MGGGIIFQSGAGMVGYNKLNVELYMNSEMPKIASSFCFNSISKYM